MEKRFAAGQAEQRRHRIIEEVMTSGHVLVDELAERCGVSRMTVHRDLDLLVARGLVRKERGGASAGSSLLFESNFHYRAHQQINAKRALAAAACRLVNPGSAIMLDDSSTTLQMVGRLRQRGPLTVISNSLPVLQALGDERNIDLIFIGGHYDPTFCACFGLGCEKAISALRAEVAFLSSSAVLGGAAFHQDQEVVRAKRAMMSCAERRVLLVDHTKFGRTALNHFAELSEFDRILVDSGLDAETLAALRDKRLPVDVVGVEGTGGDDG